MSPDQRLAWALRALWVTLPFTVGSAAADALDGRDAAMPAAVALWSVWAVVLVATLVPHPISLTAVRAACGASAAATVASAIDGARSSPVLLAALASVAVVAIGFSPGVGRINVNGPAYGDERRYPLRPPGPLLVAPIPLAWLVAVGAPAAAVLLLGGGRWIAGGIAAVIGLPAAAVSARALHQLSRRWIVFVPAGIVLHDHQALADPVLFTRQMVATMGAAPADSDACDLTLGAPGLALELRLKEPTPLGKRRAGRALGDEVTATAVLCTPTRPGVVLDEAARRRIPTARQ